MTKLDFGELESAIEWVSDPASDNYAYISNATGRIYWVSDELDLEEEIPEDIEDESLYVSVPHKNDLELGRNLVFEFAGEYLPHRAHDIRGIFSKRGAYSNYKRLLEHERLLERWYDFERKAIEKELRDWANANGFELMAPGAESDS